MNVNRLNQELTRLYGQRANEAREGTKARPAGEAVDHAETTSAGHGDSVVLSARVRELRRVVDVIRNLPDIREARVEELRSEIAAGTYQVSDDHLVDRLLGGRGA